MNLIKNIDFLSFKVSFTFNDKGEIRLKTIMGGILSIFLLLLSSIFTFYFLIRLFNRQDANVIYSTEISENLNLSYSIKIPFIFRLSETYSKPIPNENIYHYYIRFWYTIENSSIQYYEEIPMSNCNINKHFSEYKEYFKNMNDLNSFICPEIRLKNQTLYGIYGGNNPFSYYDFSILKCLNNNIYNMTCNTEEEIQKKLSDSYLDMRYIDYSMDFRNKQKVDKIVIKNERFSISSTMYKRIWLFLTDIKFISDKGIIFQNNYEENFFTYDSMRFDTDLRNIDLLDEPGNFLAFSILNSGKINIYNRKYFKFQDNLATIGGVIKSISIFCTILNYFNAKNAYYTKIITDFIIQNQIKKNVTFLNDTEKLLFNKNNKVSSTKSINSRISFFQKSSLGNNAKNNLLYVQQNNDKNLNHTDIRNSNSYQIIKQKDKFKKKYVSHFLPLYLSSKSNNDKNEIKYFIKIIHKKLNIINILTSIEKNRIIREKMVESILKSPKDCFNSQMNTNIKSNNFIKEMNYVNEFT